MRAKAQCKVNKGNPLGACGSLSAGFKPEYLSPLVLIQNKTQRQIWRHRLKKQKKTSESVKDGDAESEAEHENDGEHKERW